MEALFDILGPEARTPSITDALADLATTGETERGSVYTRPEIVGAILDLAGYTADQPLHRRRALEPSFGGGDFLLEMLDRLLQAFARSGGRPADAHDALHDALRAVELHQDSFDSTARAMRDRLAFAGVSQADAPALVNGWLVRDDFLLAPLPGAFDFVIGNPPYVRQERIPAALLEEYRARYRTLYDRADLYVPFFERSLDLLADGGTLGFICANRWMKNKYGAPLRDKIASEFRLLCSIDLEGVDAFHSDVIAYPAITMVRRDDATARLPLPVPARVPTPDAVARLPLREVVAALRSNTPQPSLVNEVVIARGAAPWLLDDAPRIALMRRIEATYPALEQTGCKVGIGVATGCDRAFIGDFDALPVEPARKLPLVMARDLVAGEIRWGGKGVVNPFEPDGTLASLDAEPLFGAYIHAHADAIGGRHVAGKNPDSWYRTIDRIWPELVTTPKLLVPDIKGEAAFVLDEGRYYPHHNLYFITAGEWDLRALQAVLRSSVTLMTIATYCTRMAGGFLRFQAQYLRRIRLPQWAEVPPTLRARLIDAAASRDQNVVDAPVFELYGLSPAEADVARRIARDAQVTGKAKPRT